MKEPRPLLLFDSSADARKANRLKRRRERLRADRAANPDKYRVYDARKRAKRTPEQQAEHDAKQRAYYAANRDRLKQKQKEYRQRRTATIPHELRAKRKAYHTSRFASDEQYRAAFTCRKRIRNALEYRGVSKTTKASVLLGCSGAELALHLSSQFTEGMTWSNHGDRHDCWVIDHIIPCAAFDLTDPAQQLVCFNYKNLQPLWYLDNASKADRLDWSPKHMAVNHASEKVEAS